MTYESANQPLLPQVRMVWFFIIVTILAVALGIIRAAEQGQALAAALVLAAIFVGLFALLAAMSFLAAFMMGAVEKAVVGKREETSNPFSDGSLPEQIIPPQHIENL